MRILFDANILLSYLLSPNAQSATHLVVTRSLFSSLTILRPTPLFDELVRKVSSKPYIAQRITIQDIEEFMEILLATTEPIPEIAGPLPSVVRDPKDDYLIAYGLVGEADYLVTFDKDLLGLGRVEEMQIVLPSHFMRVLEHYERGLADSLDEISSLEVEEVTEHEH